MARDPQSPLDRLLARPGNREAFELLSQDLAGSELSTFLLRAFEARAASRSLSDVRQQYEQDRFVATAPVDALRLARIEVAALEAAATAGFDAVGLAPLAPLGLHYHLGGTPQNNVVTTNRGTEVAADPTNVLALEAARTRATLLRSKESRSTVVDLATTQRVTRAQHFSGPRSFAHFAIFGLLTAGRDSGDFRFEIETVARQIDVLITTLRALIDAPIGVRLSPFNTELADECDQLCRGLEGQQVAAEVWADRDHGRGYYRNLCFRIDVQLEGETVEVGDGGDVYWMQELLQSRKERMVIGGLGLERLAMVADG